MMFSYRRTLEMPELLEREVQRRRNPLIWSEEEIDDLVEARCRANPPTYRNIAANLNRNRSSLLGSDPSKEGFTVRDCINCWHRLFPTAQDANRTMEYVREVERVWPGTYVHPEVEGDADVDGPPKLTALHIVWPWSKELMTTLGNSIFCDATFNVTVYNYKITALTTLDGNRHHRPLMVSFIMRSTADQWATIFDIFKRKYVLT